MDTNIIYTGDATTMGHYLEDASVDLVFSDPPYLREYLPLYGWLAQVSARILKPGCFCFAYGAAEHLPDHIRRMEKYLTYFWLFPLRHMQGWPRLWHKRLMSAYKPVLVYTNGKAKKTPWMGTMHSDTKDKRYHEWGQGIGFAIKMIEMLTDPEDVVFDPFGGGGTTFAAAHALNRRYVGFEIDPEKAAIIRERLSGPLGIDNLIERPVQESFC